MNILFTCGGTAGHVNPAVALARIFQEKHPGCRVLFTSTFEVYGEIPDRTRLSEEDYGLIDYNQIRSGYPESKRTAELLVRSFVEEYGADAVIARLSSIYGPTMTKGDHKPAAQFIRSAPGASAPMSISANSNRKRLSAAPSTCRTSASVRPSPPSCA